MTNRSPCPCASVRRRRSSGDGPGTAQRGPAGTGRRARAGRGAACRGGGAGGVRRLRGDLGDVRRGDPRDQGRHRRVRRIPGRRAFVRRSDRAARDALRRPADRQVRARGVRGCTGAVRGDRTAADVGDLRTGAGRDTPCLRRLLRSVRRRHQPCRRGGRGHERAARPEPRARGVLFGPALWKPHPRRVPVGRAPRASSPRRARCCWPRPPVRPSPSPGRSSPEWASRWDPRPCTASPGDACPPRRADGWSPPCPASPTSACSVVPASSASSPISSPSAGRSARSPWSRCFWAPAPSPCAAGPRPPPRGEAEVFDHRGDLA